MYARTIEAHLIEGPGHLTEIVRGIAMAPASSKRRGVKITCAEWRCDLIVVRRPAREGFTWEVRAVSKEARNLGSCSNIAENHNPEFAAAEAWGFIEAAATVEVTP